jgi:type III secretory pathway component EscS
MMCKLLYGMVLALVGGCSLPPETAGTLIGLVVSILQSLT